MGDGEKSGGFYFRVKDPNAKCKWKKVNNRWYTECGYTLIEKNNSRTRCQYCDGLIKEEK